MAESARQQRELARQELAAHIGGKDGGAGRGGNAKNVSTSADTGELKKANSTGGLTGVMKKKNFSGNKLQKTKAQMTAKAAHEEVKNAAVPTRGETSKKSKLPKKESSKPAVGHGNGSSKPAARRSKPAALRS